MTELAINTAKVFGPLLKPSRYKGAWGGRGSGKSHFMAGAVVEYCLLHPGARVVCIREVQKTLAQSAKLLIENKIQEMAVGHLFRDRGRYCTRPSMTQIGDLVGTTRPRRRPAEVNRFANSSTVRSFPPTVITNISMSSNLAGAGLESEGTIISQTSTRPSGGSCCRINERMVLQCSSLQSWIMCFIR